MNKGPYYPPKKKKKNIENAMPYCAIDILLFYRKMDIRLKLHLFLMEIAIFVPIKTSTPVPDAVTIP